MLDMVLRILGLIALGGLIGAVIGIIATPFILQLTAILAYAVASIIAVILGRRTWEESLKGFPPLINPMNTIVHQSNNKQDNIRYPKRIHDVRNNSNGMVNGSIMHQSQTTTQQTATNRQTANDNALDAVNQPTIKNILNTFRNVIHRLMLFYRSYYGHSTKVEKNLVTQTVTLGCFSLCHCEEPSDEAIPNQLPEIATPRQVGARNDRRQMARMTHFLPLTGC